MRIISGTAKGRKLFTPPQQERSIRPTSDRAREALFSILGDRVSGATVLDLFAGTGALGIEAFSRQARFVVFIDNNSLALQLIKKNILLCFKDYSGDRGLRVMSHDLSKGLLQIQLPKETHSGFDIIFADPPYSQELSFSVLESINKSSLLQPNGLLIVEERNNVALPQSLSNLKQTDRRLYGEAAFCFYRSNRTEL